MEGGAIVARQRSCERVSEAPQCRPAGNAAHRKAAAQEADSLEHREEGGTRRTRYVVSNRFDGLGGRLINLLLSISLAERLDARWLVHWPDNKGLSGNALDYLFGDARFKARKKSPEGRRIDWLDLARDEEMRGVRLVGNHDRLSATDPERYDTICLRSVDLAALTPIPGFTEAEIRTSCHRAFADLALHPEATRILCSFKERARLAGAVGVHVRRGDIEAHPQILHRDRMVELRDYFSALGEYPDMSVFLATDSKAVVRAFKRQLGPRLLRLRTPGFSRTSARDLRYAMCEMLLLSSCRFILSGPSNFPRCAALIGDREHLVLEPANRDPEWERRRGNWGLRHEP